MKQYIEERSGPIGAVIAFLALACASVLCLSWWMVTQAREVQMDEAVLTTKNLSRAVAKHVNGSFAEVDHMTASLIETIGFTDKQHLDHLQPILVGHVSRMTQLRAIFISDSAGRWLVSTEPDRDPSSNISDREYFKFHQTHFSDAIHIGRPILSRTSKKWVIPLSRRISAPDGRFEGVLLATVDIEHLTHYLAQFDVLSEGSIMLALNDGGVLDRRPFTNDVLKADLHGLSNFTAAIGERTGTSSVISPFDGVKRIVSHERFDDYGIHAFAALSEGEVLAHWKRASIQQLLLASTLCLLFLSVAGYVLVLVNRRSRSERHLREMRDELSAANAQLEQTSRQDGLTGLWNRRRFDEAMMSESEHSNRHRAPLSILMIDIDEFKQFNDCYGHQQGDDCLRSVAHAVRSASQRPRDVIARYGGEEIALLLPETEDLGAMIVAQRVQTEIRRLSLEHRASRIGHVTVSIGVASGTVDGYATTAKGILAAADAALYQAKRSGRNRTCQAQRTATEAPTPQEALIAQQS